MLINRKHFNVYKEVNYKYTYNNTLKHIILRKYNLKDIYIDKALSIRLYFWYRELSIDEVTNSKLFDNFSLVWLLLNEKFRVRNYDSTLRRGIYYYRFVAESVVAKKNIYKFFDILINGVMPLMREVKIVRYIINNDICLKLCDMSMYSNIKIYEFYYTENVTDYMYIKFHLFQYRNFFIKKYLNIFKLYS